MQKPIKPKIKVVMMSLKSLFAVKEPMKTRNIKKGMSKVPRINVKAAR